MLLQLVLDAVGSAERDARCDARLSKALTLFTANAAAAAHRLLLQCLLAAARGTFDSCNDLRLKDLVKVLRIANPRVTAEQACCVMRCCLGATEVESLHGVMPSPPGSISPAAFAAAVLEVGLELPLLYPPATDAYELRQRVRVRWVKEVQPIVRRRELEAEQAAAAKAAAAEARRKAVESANATVAAGVGIVAEGTYVHNWRVVGDTRKSLTLFTAGSMSQIMANLNLQLQATETPHAAPYHAETTSLFRPQLQHAVESLRRALRTSGPLSAARAWFALRFVEHALDPLAHPTA